MRLLVTQINFLGFCLFSFLFVTLVEIFSDKVRNRQLPVMAGLKVYRALIGVVARNGSRERV